MSEKENADKAAADKAAADKAAADKAAGAAKSSGKKKPEPVKQPAYHLLPGKSITSKRGILTTERGAKLYTEVKPGDVHGGRDGLEALVKSGHVGKA